MNPKYLILSILLFMPLLCSGQSLSSDEEQLIINVNQISENGYFTFDNPKGSVLVTGYSGDLIIVTGTIRHPVSDQDSNNSFLRQVKYALNITAEIRGNQVLLLYDSRGKTVDFDIKIPEYFSLNIKSQDNGEIRIMKINGDIEVENPHGDITLLGIIGSASLNSTEGNIKADFKEIDASKYIMISSFEGDLELTIPENSRLNFVLKSTNNEINTNLDIVPEKRPSVIRQSRIKTTYTLDDKSYGKLNGGGPVCSMNTYNGRIDIKKRG